MLYKFLTTHQFNLVFPTRYGGKQLYDSCRGDFVALIEKLGIKRFDGALHAFRRCFVTNYIKENGNPFKLQRMMGRTSLKMTNEYVKLVTEDLSQE